MRTSEIAFIDRLRTYKHLPSVRCPALHSAQARIIFVLDNSGSMGDEDYPPSRLRAGIDAIREFVDARHKIAPGDLTCMIVFCEQAQVLWQDVPLAHTKPFLAGKLKSIEPDNGTDIEQGLIAADSIISRSTIAVQNQVVLLTDGFGGTPERIAQKIKDKGAIIDVIGIGGSPAEVYESCLKQVASVVNGELRYRFIGDKSRLLSHFRNIARDIVYIGARA